MTMKKLNEDPDILYPVMLTPANTTPDNVQDILYPADVDLDGEVHSEGDILLPPHLE